VQGSVANEPYQCFQVDIYQPYYFGLDIYSTTVDDYSQCWLQYYNFAGCTGESGYQIVIGPQGGNSTTGWAHYSISAPSDFDSNYAAIQCSTDSDAIYIDQVYLNTSDSY
jgi:hypothetical protein